MTVEVQRVASPPSGFEPLQAMDPVMTFMGPLYWRDEGGHISLGFIVAERHQNPRGNCHGGVLASFADLQLGINSSLESGLGVGGCSAVMTALCI